MSEPRVRPPHRLSLGRLGLRGRLMFIGISGLVVALVVGALAFYGALTWTINRTLDNEADAAASEVAAMVNQDRLPSPVPVSGAQVVQVVDASSRVVGGSATADRLTPLLRPDELADALAGRPVAVSGGRLGLTGPLRVRALRAGPAAAPVSVIVAVPVGDVLAVRSSLRVALLIAVPLLVAVLAAIAWRVIGRTLRPVEELRVGAERISGTAADEQLPVPPVADEIRALALTLNGMLERLAQARARQRSFVADAAHELRSPLASMRAQLEVAARLGEDSALTEDLLLDVHRLSALVEDLLLLARADADERPPARPSVVDVPELLAEVAAAYEGARVRVEVSAAGPMSIGADRAELRRAVDNLMTNAVRHARSAVQLSVADRDGRAVLAISDDGPGVPVADRKRVFERFTRLDDARTRDAGGSGLGLAIVRELVGRADGEVQLVDPLPPWTSRVEITVPVVATPTHDHDPVSIR